MTNPVSFLRMFPALPLNPVLRRKLAGTEHLLDALRMAAEPGAQHLTGTPHASGYRDKLGALAAEIADVSAEAEQLREVIREQETAVTAFIAEIPDVHTRMIFQLRFLRGMTWRDVADAVGGKNTAHNVRNICYRYFRRNIRDGEKS